MVGPNGDGESMVTARPMELASALTARPNGGGDLYRLSPMVVVINGNDSAHGVASALTVRQMMVVLYCLGADGSAQW